jgi:hypothetical protein
MLELEAGPRTRPYAARSQADRRPWTEGARIVISRQPDGYRATCGDVGGWGRTRREAVNSLRHMLVPRVRREG